MAEDLTFEIPAHNTSHRMFMTPELVKEAYPDKRDRHKVKKKLGKVIPQLLGTPVEQPMEQAPKGPPKKKNQQTYRRRKRNRAEIQQN